MPLYFQLYEMLDKLLEELLNDNLAEDLESAEAALQSLNEQCENISKMS